MGQPIIYVSMNYRLAAWGFAGSEEIKKAGVGNLGLRDQRLAFKWVQKYINNFGGDPSKVTIWGESAGAISVALQMITNDGNTEGLFRGGFMQSGAAFPVGDISGGQADFDKFVNDTGCSKAEDKLDCLRSVPEEVFQNAVDMSAVISGFRSLNLAWAPRTDGKFLKEDSQKLVAKGVVAKIPYVNGDDDDEGTFFSIPLGNLSTDDEAIEYIKQNYAQKADQSTLDTIAKLYPSDPAVGSPFDTGNANQITPQWKRLAAFQGDFAFQGPRRHFMENTADRQPAWSFLNKRLKSTPGLGAYHNTDLTQTIGGHGELQDYIIRFVNHLDPNVGSNNSNQSSEGLIYWPSYTTKSKILLTVLDGPVPLDITKDDFRVEPIDFLIKFTLDNPL